MAILTKHASIRMAQRCGIQKSIQAKMVRRVWRHGVTHAETSESVNLKHWVDGLYLSQRKPNKILLYGNGAYLFKDEVLITVLNIPENLQAEVNRLRGLKGTKINGKEYEIK